MRSRNLVVGVWNDEAKGFIGLREKFGSRYLFTELHWDADPHYGTAVALKALDMLPNNVEVREGWRKTTISAWQENINLFKVLDDLDRRFRNA